MGEILALSPNRWLDSLAFKYAVLHTTEGTSSLAWLRNPASQVSATLLIPREGPDWWRLVGKTDAAWHAGFVAAPRTALYDGVNPNLEAEGYELEGFASQPVTDWQVATVARIILANGKPFCMHADLATQGTYYRSDPGVENFARISAAVTGGNMAEFTAAQQQAIDNRIREIVMAEDIAPFAVFRALGIYTGNIPKTTARGGARVPGQPFKVPVTGQRGTWPKSLGPEPLTAAAKRFRTLSPSDRASARNMAARKGRKGRAK